MVPVVDDAGVEMTNTLDGGCELGPVPVIGVTVGRKLLPQPETPKTTPAEIAKTVEPTAQRRATDARAGKCSRKLLIPSLSCLLVLLAYPVIARL